jgi:hypothetical protein
MDLIKKGSMLAFCLALGYVLSMVFVILYDVQDPSIFWATGLNAGLFMFWLTFVWGAEENRHVTVPGVDK